MIKHYLYIYMSQVFNTSSFYYRVFNTLWISTYQPKAVVYIIQSGDCDMTI